MVTQNDHDTTSKTQLLDRRSLLKGAGVSLAGLLSVGTLGSVAAADDDGLRLVITSPSEVTFEFTVDGDAELVTDGRGYKSESSSEEVVDNDDGTCSVRGRTGNGFGDGFRITGEILRFDQLEGEYTIYIDGEETTVEELTGSPVGSDEAEEPSEADLIGGGEGYDETVTADDADVVVSSGSELASALSSAASGDVVFLDSDVEAGTDRFTVPSGVTLASDRGVDGADGAAIRTDQLHSNHLGMVRAESDARVTGLRVVGPLGGDGWKAHSYDYEVTGVYAQASGVEVDNVEASGWGYAGVYTADDTHVHHCELHHNNVDGLGYGVMANNSANPIIEYNEFYHNRHAVTGSGSGGYTARYNYVHGPFLAHVFDQHRPGGTTTTIHNNTIEVVDNAQKNKNVPAVAIRGVPSESTDVYDNWFHNPKQPRNSPGGWSDEAIIQVHSSGWQNVEFQDNHYGADEPADDVGCPR